MFEQKAADTSAAAARAAIKFSKRDREAEHNAKLLLQELEEEEHVTEKLKAVKAGKKMKKTFKPDVNAFSSGAAAEADGMHEAEERQKVVKKIVQKEQEAVYEGRGGNSGK